MPRVEFPAGVAVALLLAGCGQGSHAPVENDAAGLVESADPAPPAERPVVDAAGAGANSTDSIEVSACLVQDGERIAENRLHAIGTEPFWATDVKGRCVTYSTPEDQDGTRVWTHFEGTKESGRWTGALDNQRFVMVTESEPGCSDGMSDKRYPIKVTLTVRGEQRSGCAEPR